MPTVTENNRDNDTTLFRHNTQGRDLGKCVSSVTVEYVCKRREIWETDFRRHQLFITIKTQKLKMAKNKVLTQLILFYVS